eukprot:GDKJ01043282.1.p1 GENE.GDKJ01043282.1~~GDKJ01043282.1.p1  ORF type:complete len:368 (+),score=97.73 GDKJ01043282.1:205-1308(+)
MGLVGLPNVGKSTTFNFLSKLDVPAENRPFCTIDPHEARVNVPDEKFEKLCEIIKPQRGVPANLTIYDIAGLIRGASEGQGLGNAFLSHISAVDGIYHVVRAFDDPEVTHAEGEVNPENDMEIINDELRFKDIAHCERLEKEFDTKSRKGQDKAMLFSKEVMTKALNCLREEKKWIRDCQWDDKEIDVLNTANFLTAKPVVYLVNMSENDFVRQKNKYLMRIKTWVDANCPGPIVPYSANFESTLQKLPDEESRKSYMADVGAKMSMVSKIINTGYSALNLIHFFTFGEVEVRCWTLRKGSKAPQAAGCIHSDMEKCFISADVYKYDDLVAHGSEAAVRANVGIQPKGKDYVVEEGDLIVIKHNAKK